MGMSSPGQAGMAVPLVPTTLWCSVRTTMGCCGPPQTTMDHHSPP